MLGQRIYDVAVRDALVVLWEASDRICGKRLKALMPTLVEAMDRHRHMKLGAEIRTGLLAMGAATVDRSLRKVREQAGGKRRRRTAPPSSLLPLRVTSSSTTTSGPHTSLAYRTPNEYLVASGVA